MYYAFAMKNLHLSLIALAAAVMSACGGIPIIPGI